MNTEEPALGMPAWPLLMSTDLGARYLTLSTGSFRGLLRRAGIRPVDLGLGVVRWRRADLETLVSSLPARSSDSLRGAEPSFDLALEAAAQRRSRPRKAGL